MNFVQGHIRYGRNILIVQLTIGKQSVYHFKQSLFAAFFLSFFKSLYPSPGQAAIYFFLSDHVHLHFFQHFVVQIIYTNAFQSLIDNAAPEIGNILFGSSIF